MTPANKKCEDLYSLLDDLCDGTISVADAARLDVLLQSDPSARREYLSYLEVHAGLGLISGKRLNTPSPLSYPSFDLLSPSPFPLPHPFIGGPVFSYMAASVIVCLMLLGAWAYKISHHRDLGVVAGSLGSTTSGPSDQPELVFVGRITGMKDCHWADADTQTIVGASVPLGRKYALSSGLMEITYQSGARVILEGPCTYKLESSAGGFLERGKLTANVRTQNSKLKTQSAEPSLLSSLSSPLFSVRTPTAVVTDLGTEFGVEVAENGDTTSHVFQGSVKVQATNLPSPASGKGAGGEGGTILLAVGESVTVKKDEAETLRITRPATPPKFTLRMPLPDRLGVLDLLDVVAGGDGMGRRRERGIDPVSGEYVYTPIGRGRDGDRDYRPVYWSWLLDGAFVPEEGTSVQLDSAGNAFDGFSGASGRIFGHIWARAAEADPNAQFDGVRPWMYSLGRVERFMPERRGLLALHPNAGLTFDLQAARDEYRGLRPERFTAAIGLAELSDEALMPEGTVDFRLFIDGRLKLERLGLKHKDDAAKLDVELDPTDRFLTLVATDGGDGITSDWFVVGDPVLKMTRAKSAGPSGNGAKKVQGNDSNAQEKR